MAAHRATRLISLKVPIGPIVLAFLALGAANLLAQSGPVTYSAEYEASYKGRDVGTSTFSVTRQGDADTFVYESLTIVKGLLKLVSPKPAIDRSVFKYVHGDIRSVEFWHEDGSRKGEDNEHIQFDWEHGHAVMSGDFGTKNVELKPGTLDRGNLQVAVMNDLNRGIEPKRYAVADGDAIDVYNYTSEGTRRVATGIGEIEVVTYAQQREGSSRRTVIDMAPSLGYVPVRIEQYRNGEIQSAFLLTSLRRD